MPAQPTSLRALSRESEEPVANLLLCMDVALDPIICGSACLIRQSERYRPGRIRMQLKTNQTVGVPR